MALSPTELIQMADRFATDLLQFAQSHGMSNHDVLMIIAVSERLLQKGLCPGDSASALKALQEADATLAAKTQPLEVN